MQIDTKHNLRKNAFLVAGELSKNFAQKRKLNFADKIFASFAGQENAKHLYTKYYFSLLLPYIQKKFLNIYNTDHLGQYPSPIRPLSIDEENILLELKERFCVSEFLKSMALFFHDFILYLKTFALAKSVDSGKLAVDICQGIDVLTKRSELNWKNSDNFSFDKIILFVNKSLFSINNFNEEVLNEFIVHGTTVYTNHPILKRKANLHTLNFPYSDSRNIPNTPLNEWIRPLCWTINFLFWKNLFLRLGVKIWSFVNEDMMSNLIQRYAIEKIGGVSIARQRSNLGETWGIAYQSSHIFLSWNEEGVKHFKQRHNKIECNIIAGHPFTKKRQYHVWEKIAAQIRSENGFTTQHFVIGLFDNVFGPEFELSEKIFNELFYELFDILEKHPQTRLIYKVKKKVSFTDPVLNIKLEYLVAQKKIAIFSANYLPSIISMASDFVIGTESSSPIYEAFILNKRAVAFWPSPDMDHPVFTNGKTCVRSSKEMRQAIEETLLSSDSEWGKLRSENLKRVDYYADGKGPDRMELLLDICINSNWNDRYDLYNNIRNSGLLCEIEHL